MVKSNLTKYPRGKNPNSRKGGFKKGYNSWLGKRLSEEHKEKIRLTKLGKNNPKNTETYLLKAKNYKK